METHPATTSQTARHLEALLACGVLRIIPVPGAKPKNHGCPGFFLEMFQGRSFSFFFPQKKMWGITESPSMFSSWWFQPI